MVMRALWAVLLAPLCVSLLQAESPELTNKYTVPAGTTLHCRLTQTVSTKTNIQGDSFVARVSEPLLLDSKEVVPVGATLEGRIARLDRPGRVKGVGQMRLVADKLTFPDGRSFPLNALLLSVYDAEDARVVGSEGMVKGRSSRREDTEEIAGGTIVGGLVGLIFSHPVVGGVIGGTAGVVDRLRRRGMDLSLPSGTQLNYQLTHPLQLSGGTKQAAFSRRASGAGN